METDYTSAANVMADTIINIGRKVSQLEGDLNSTKWRLESSEREVEQLKKRNEEYISRNYNLVSELKTLSAKRDELVSVLLKASKSCSSKQQKEISKIVAQNK